MIFGQQIQPSEFGKITTILMMAALVSSRREILNSVKEYLKCLAILMIPIASIMLQPDLGTSMVVFVIGLVILFIGGANRRFLIITLIVIVILVFGILFLDQFLGAKLGRDVLLKQYQVDRLLVFLNNDRDPGGLGYNLQQAKISIGSGGLLGQGYMSGTQSSLGFLPEAPTDFIFCVLAEEFGFLGSLGLLFLYSLLLGLSLRVAMKADGFGRLIVGGCMGLWIFQIIQNIGMTCGLMPITGIPLPFFSFGSSFMIVNFMAVGLIVSVHAHKMEQESKRLLA
jgi:rod shape determining protein RodA